jgi:hypothetical protein
MAEIVATGACRSILKTMSLTEALAWAAAQHRELWEAGYVADRTASFLDIFDQRLRGPRVLAYR